MKQGEIVLIPFPFTDLKTNKIRPALIVSGSSLKGNDIIACGITSKSTRKNTVSIDNCDLIKGKLPLKSYIAPGYLASLNKKIVVKNVAKLSLKKRKEVLNKIAVLLKLS